MKPPETLVESAWQRQAAAWKPEAWKRTANWLLGDMEKARLLNPFYNNPWFVVPPPMVVRPKNYQTGNRPPVLESRGPGMTEATTGFTTTSQASDTLSTGAGDFLDLNETFWENSRNVETTQTWEEAWEEYASAAGIGSIIDVPINWWPGLTTPDLDTIANAPGSWSEGPTPMEMEPWRPPGQISTFTNEETGEEFSRWTRYDPNRAAQQFMLMGSATRAKMTQLMADAGILDEEWGGISDFAPEAAAGFAEALALANYYGQPVEYVLKQRGELFDKLNPGGGGRGSGGGGGPKVQLEVPNYETLVQNAKEMLAAELQRDPAQWEMTLLADEMQKQYGSWAAATRARMLGGNGTFEIPDPTTLSTAFMEETWGDEISRLEDIGDTTATNQYLIAAATKGAQMVGGLSG